MAVPARAERLTKADRTRARILDAAARIFLTQGYGGAGVRDISAAVDMQAGSIYYHFTSRDDIVTEVLRVGQERISGAVAARLAALPANARPVDRFDAVMRAHVESLAAQGDYTSAAVRLLYTAPASMREQQVRDARGYAALWRDLLREAQSAGEVRKDVDPAAMRMFILGALNSTPDWYDPQRRGLSGSQLAEEFSRVFLDGIATRRRRRRSMTVRAPAVSALKPTASVSRGESTRLRILDSAAHAFRENGFDNTTLNDVAAAAGLQRGSLYYHFTSREQLAEQLLHDAWKRTSALAKASVAALPADASAVDGFGAAMAAHLMSLLGEGGYSAGLVHVLAQVPEEVRARSATFRRSYLRSVRQLAQQAQDAGDIRADLHLPSTVLIIIGALNWAVEWYDPSGPLAPEELTRQALTVVLDGLSVSRRRPKQPSA